MIDAWMNSRISSNYPTLCQIASQSPVDMELINVYMLDPQSNLNTLSLFRIGALDFWVTAKASIRTFLFSPNGILLGTSIPDDPVFSSAIGQAFDPGQIAGLEAPFRAAMAGDRNPKNLYTELVPNQKIVFAGPLFNTKRGHADEVAGIFVIIFDAIPTNENIPMYILDLAGKSLGIFLLGTGLMGALFGAFFAHGLAGRFKRISATTDRWSEGDFSSYIDDTSGDEVSQFTQRLNNMARQLQGLLRRRQDMAVSEERNRLARDLHDSAKQQALAASFELGTALTLYDRDRAGAKKHLQEADALVDSVRKELTNLVDELRPQSMDGQDFSEILKEHALEWSQRSGIELSINFEGHEQLSLAIRETLFRIAQEALANVARHSSARHVDVFLEYGTNSVTLIVKDYGHGFDTGAKHDGLGLHSMQERTEALGGSFTIDSAPGQGTRINITLPKES